MALMRQASTCQSERSSDSLPPRLRVKSNAPLPPPLSIPKVFSPETHPHSVSECCGIGLLAVGMGLRPAKLHEKLPLRRRCPPGTDETAMDFRRLLPEIRWQSRLSPVSGTGSPDWFFDPVPGFAHGRCTPFVMSPNRISPSHSRAPRPSVKLRNTIAMLEILGFSATHQARLVRQRAVSSVELVQAHLAHIATVNPRIHAVIEVFAAPALAAADAADRAVAQGIPTGPLCGVPFSIKDSIELAGAVCSAGTLGRRDAPPATRDATL